MARPRDDLTPGPALDRRLAESLPAVVALVGDEPYLQLDGLRSVRASLPDAEPEIEDLDGPRTAREAAAFEPAAVFDPLRTASLFSSSRMVVLRRGSPFVAAHGDSVVAYLEHPAPGGVLVLFLDGIDGRTKAGKALRARGLVVACRRLYDRPAPWERGRVPEYDHELGRWTASRARRLGRRMAPEAAHRLTEHTGNELGVIAATLDALIAYVGERPEITLSDVDAIAGGSGERSLFRISDLIMERRTTDAVACLRAVFREGLDLGAKTERNAAGIATIVVTTLGRRVRSFYRARRALEGGRSRADVVAEFGPRQRGLVPAFEGTLKRFDEATLRTAIGVLAEADVALKRGVRNDPERVLEELVVTICEGVPRPDLEKRERRWA